jgi:hypothetical protein
MKKRKKVTTRIVTNYTPSDDAITEIVYCGNITELKTLEKRSTRISRYKHISKTEYYDTKTGEVRKHHINANQNKKRNLNKSFENLLYLINNNFQSNINELHVILTYSEKMDDFDKASRDFKTFWEKLNYNYSDLDYIRIIEPQHTGTWHIHVLIKSKNKGYLSIPKEKLEKFWGNGYAWVDKIKNNDNIGAYFMAHLKNIDVFEKESEKPNDTKCIVKGARLHFYPQGKRFYSYSKGIKKPVTIRTTYGKAKEKFNFDDAVFNRTYEVVLQHDDENKEERIVNHVTRSQFNSERKKKS